LELGAPSARSEYSGQGAHAYGAQRPQYTYDAFNQQAPYASSSYTHTQQQAPSSYNQQAGYAPTSSSYSTFPAPRRASALAPPIGESTIAPGSHRHAPIDPRHRDYDEPPRPKHKNRHTPSSSVDEWETGSDASYYARPNYARPKGTRSHSGSSLSDITTNSKVVHHHHHHHHHHTPKGSPGLHGHSPSSPSPLARDRDLGGSGSHVGRSPLSPRSQNLHAEQKGRKISALGAETSPSPYKPITGPLAMENDRDLRTLHEGQEKRYRHHSASFDPAHKSRSQAGQGYASDDEGRHSHRGRETRPKYDRENSSTRGNRKPKHRTEAYPDEYDDENDHHHREESHKHHRPRSHSHVPPPLPFRGHSPSQSLQVPHQMPDIGNLSLSGRDPRPRARSMQYAPSPGSLAGYGGGLAPPGGGGGGYPSPGSLAGYGGGGRGLAPPSISGGMGMGMMGGGMGMGMEGGVGYDDGGSVAGSAMTFMDGANRGGMTSQYGLPKYPHQAKPDPRRCVLSLVLPQAV
jgi:hypothetical protein